MVIEESRIAVGRKANPVWMEIRASIETPIQLVIQIANAFLAEVDVECYHPNKGTFVFRESSGVPIQEIEWYRNRIE